MKLNTIIKITLFIIQLNLNWFVTIVTSKTENVPAVVYKCVGNRSDLTEDFLEILVPSFLNPKTYIFTLKNSTEELKCPTKDRFLYGIAKSQLPAYINPGGVLIIGISPHVIYREVTDYCFQSIGEEIVLEVCNMDTGEDSFIIQKCCFSHYDLLGYDEKNRIGCQSRKNDNNWYWTPSMLENLTTHFPYKKKSNVVVQPGLYAALSNFDFDGVYLSWVLQIHNSSVQYKPNLNPVCFQLYKNKGFAVCTTGEAWALWELEKENFCVDVIQEFSENSSNSRISIALLSFLNETELRSVNEQMKSQGEFFTSIIVKIPKLVSLIFLLLTILVYILLWERQNGYGYTILCFLFSNFMYYIIVCISFFIEHNGTEHKTEFQNITVSHDYVVEENNFSTSSCKILAILDHYFFLATFSWLSAICFDIFWAFRKVRSNTLRTKTLRKFFIYSGISWIAPLFIVSIGLFLDSSLGKEEMQYMEEKCSMASFNLRTFIPRYGGKGCSIAFEACGLYKYFPIGISLGLNTIFFGATLKSMYTQQKEIDDVLKNSSTKKQSNYVWRLFFLMGLVWILELISWCLMYHWFFSDDFVVVKLKHRDIEIVTYSGYFAFFSKIVQLVQSITIFYILVCKKAIYNQLWQRHQWLRPILSPFAKLACCKKRNTVIINPSTSRSKTTKA